MEKLKRRLNKKFQTKPFRVRKRTQQHRRRRELEEKAKITNMYKKMCDEVDTRKSNDKKRRIQRGEGRNHHSLAWDP